MWDGDSSSGGPGLWATFGSWIGPRLSLFLSERYWCLLLPLIALCSSTGVTPSHSAFAMHALLVDHYIQGSYYPRGGSSEIAFHTIPVIERAGGAVLTKATVQSVLLDSAGKACGESLALCFGVPARVRALGSH